MHKKPIIITSIISLSTILALSGYVIVKRKNTIAKVYAVSTIQDYSFDTGIQSYGSVYESTSQSIYPSDTDVIKEVYVQQGQQVHKGDALLSYDISSLQITYAKKQIALEQAQIHLKEAQNTLQKLQNTTPQNPIETPPVPSYTKEKIHDAYTVLDQDSFTNHEYIEGDGTKENPYVFIVSQDSVMRKSFLDVDGYVSLRIYEDDVVDPEKLVSKWDFYTAKLHITQDVVAIFLDTALQDEIDTTNAPVAYTQEELHRMILQQQQEVKRADLAVRRATIDVQSQADAMGDGIVKAKSDGVISHIGNVSNPKENGKPFLTVSSQGGTIIQASVSELLLGDVKVGDQADITDWNTGNMYTGTVTKIDTFPLSNTMGMGDYANASYYPVYIQIEGENTLEASAPVNVTYSQSKTTDNILIPKAFVRYEDGSYYVMKDVEGKLVRQIVQVVGIENNYSYAISEGVSIDDYLAFPYGKEAKVGSKTKIEEGYPQ